MAHVQSFTLFSFPSMDRAERPRPRDSGGEKSRERGNWMPRRDSTDAFRLGSRNPRSFCFSSRTFRCIRVSNLEIGTGKPSMTTTTWSPHWTLGLLRTEEADQRGRLLPVSVAIGHPTLRRQKNTRIPNISAKAHELDWCCHAWKSKIPTENDLSMRNIFSRPLFLPRE